MSVVPFIVWHTLQNDSGTLQRPCLYTGGGSVGTVALTELGSRPMPGWGGLRRGPQAAAASQQGSSGEARRSPCVASR